MPRVVALGRRGPLRELLPRFADARGLALLEGAGDEPGRWGWLAFDPQPGEFPPADVPGPFAGGFIGALSYDLGPQGERLALPRDPWQLPLRAGGTYTDFLVRDATSGECWLALGDERRERSVRARLEGPAPELARPRTRGPLVRHTSRAEHMARVEHVRADIAAGEYYQANLAHRFTRAVEGHPLAWFARLVEINPAPYMAYLDFGAGAILSASPELLLEGAGARLVTMPIKGTRRRTGAADVDRAARADLHDHPKDAAEHLMIVDLERNDLGRVATLGSVAVDELGAVVELPALYHKVSTVSATPRPATTWAALLRATFPGGSITGAPKLASMAAIAREEGEGRGFYTGSLGFLDVRGNACWNILIRTLVWRPEPAEFSFHVGGGITWSSDADAEERETLLKAARLVETLEAGA